MAGKMNIYIRIDSAESGYCGWWSFGMDGWSYLVDGRALWTISKTTGEEYSRGTACTSIRQAKREAKIACSTANSDGIVDSKASFWRQIGDKLIETKFTRDNKLKQLAKPIVLKGEDVFES